MNKGHNGKRRHIPEDSKREHMAPKRGELEGSAAMLLFIPEKNYRFREAELSRRWKPTPVPTEVPSVEADVREGPRGGGRVGSLMPISCAQHPTS